MAGLGRWATQARTHEQLAGEHAYAYARNNPTTYIDPSGLDPVLGFLPPDKPACPEPIQCTAPWNQWVVRLCESCGGWAGSDSACQAHCDACAAKYYDSCVPVGKKAPRRGQMPWHWYP